MTFGSPALGANFSAKRRQTRLTKGEGDSEVVFIVEASGGFVLHSQFRVSNGCGGLLTPAPGVTPAPTGPGGLFLRSSSSFRLLSSSASLRFLFASSSNFLSHPNSSPSLSYVTAGLQ